jgi:hypothetical protein
MAAAHTMQHVLERQTPMMQQYSERAIVRDVICEWNELTRRSRFGAIAQVELLADWLEDRMFDAKYARRNRPS